MSASRRRFYWVDCLPFADCRHSTAQTRPPPRSQGGAAGVRELAGVGADSPAVTMQSLLEKGAKQAGARRSNSGVLPIASVTDRSTFARFGVVIRTLAPPASMTVAAVRRHENSDNAPASTACWSIEVFRKTEPRSRAGALAHSLQRLRHAPVTYPTGCGSRLVGVECDAPLWLPDRSRRVTAAISRHTRAAKCAF